MGTWLDSDCLCDWIVSNIVMGTGLYAPHREWAGTGTNRSHSQGNNIVTVGADPGGAQGSHVPPIFGLAVPNLSPTLHARTLMTPPAPPPFSNPRSAPGKSNYCSAIGYKVSYCPLQNTNIHIRAWHDMVSSGFVSVSDFVSDHCSITCLLNISTPNPTRNIVGNPAFQEI